MADTAFGNGRDLTVTVTAATLPLDAMKALVGAIGVLEDEVANGVTHTAVTTGNEVTVLQTGNNPFNLYSFDLEDGTDIDAGEYIVTYNGVNV